MKATTIVDVLEQLDADWRHGLQRRSLVSRRLTRQSSGAYRIYPDEITVEQCVAEIGAFTGPPTSDRSAPASRATVPGVVKRSRSGICHDSSSRYYARTQRFVPFETLEACLESGGRLPRN